MEESIQFAKKYLEDLLSFFGLNIDVYGTSEDGEVIELNVPSSHLNGFLIGQHGDTVRSMQYLISMALRSGEFEITRVNVDVADYKKQRAGRLEEKAVIWLKEVKDSGKERHLPAMNSADRRTIHRLAGEHGLETISEGEGRDRHIVLKVSSGEPANEKDVERAESDPATETTEPEEETHDETGEAPADTLEKEA